MTDDPIVGGQLQIRMSNQKQLELLFIASLRKIARSISSNSDVESRAHYLAGHLRPHIMKK